MLAAVAAVVWVPKLIRVIEFHGWERRLQNFNPPADAVAYEEVASLVQKLLRSPGYIPATSRSNDYPDASRAAYAPAVLREGAHAGPQSAVFLHELRRPDGSPRLVHLYVKTLNQDDDLVAVHSVCFYGMVYLPSRWGSASLELAPVSDARSRATQGQGFAVVWSGQRWGTPPRLEIGRGHFLRLHPGYIDPADPTHFIIPFEVDGVRANIDGHLSNDDLIELHLRETPTTAPFRQYPRD